MSEVPAHLPSLDPPRPLVLITGFLGAGKTTLLRELLTETAEFQLAADVILNDYENAELDAETLRARAASIAPIAASCACCSGLQPLVELSLAAAASRHDLLLVEINGTADPMPLLESFTLLESRLRLQPRWQVCVIDARHFGRRGDLSLLEACQLETASHFVLSHTRTLDPVSLDAVRERIHACNPLASETDAVVLASDLSRLHSRARRLFLPETPSSRHRSLPRSIGHRLAHEFTGCQVLLPDQIDPDQIRRFLSELPAGVLRAKALVNLRGENQRHLFERVADEVMPDPLEVPYSDRVPSSVICIGPDLDPEAIFITARRVLGDACQLPA